jgi:hypothetical protein
MLHKCRPRWQFTWFVPSDNRWHVACTWDGGPALAIKQVGGAASLERLGHRRKEGWGEVDLSAVWGATAMTWAGWFAIGMLGLAVLAILLLAVVTVTGAGGFVES